jgi:hypothetical protein
MVEGIIFILATVGVIIAIFNICRDEERGNYYDR